LASLLAGCQWFSGDSQKPLPPPQPRVDREDPLRIGDRIKVEISGIAETILPVETDIKEDGTVKMAHIGSVTVVGKSPSKLETEIEARYVPDWFPHATITVTPVARYFYVLGQVTNPGRIVYAGPINVTSAIGAAGDFNPFAKKTKVQITRTDGTKEFVNCKKAISRPELDLPIYPGDRIYVDRRGL
jgi:polysaccharide export outer membrane protein